MGQDRDSLGAASGQIVWSRQLKRLCVSSMWCTQTRAGHLLIGSMNPHLIPFLCAPNLSCLIAYRKKTKLRQSCLFPSIYQLGEERWSFDEKESSVRLYLPQRSQLLCLTVLIKRDPFFYRGNSTHFLSQFYAASFNKSLSPLSFLFHHNLCLDQLSQDLHLCWSDRLITSR